MLKKALLYLLLLVCWWDEWVLYQRMTGRVGCRINGKFTHCTSSFSTASKCVYLPANHKHLLPKPSASQKRGWLSLKLDVTSRRFTLIDVAFVVSSIIKIFHGLCTVFSRALSRSTMSSKIWLSVHPRNSGSHVTIRPFARPSAPQGNECEMLVWEPLTCVNL